MSNNSKPDFEVRCGKIKAAVWSKEEQGKNGKFKKYSVKIEKSYKDNDGNWVTTDFFFPDELPALAAISDTVYKKLSIKIKKGGE